MDRNELRTKIADVIGNPSSGPLADAVDRIVDAVLGAEQREKRVTKPAETRGE